MIPIMTPHNWHWIIGGDESQAYSSAASSYVATWPADRVTRIASEAELNEVLAKFGIKGPLTTADHVRAEAQRRIILLMNARDLQDCLVKQLNANMRANELNDIRHTRALTAEEESEAATLRAMADAIKAIRAASNAMEAAPPVNYDNDTHWP